MKLYDLAKSILEKYPPTRNDDNKLIWVILGELGYISNGSISKKDFINAPSFESITRARRKIQELNPELDSNEFVKKAREDIANQKGTHIYRNKIEKKASRESLITDLIRM